jgi:RpiB/LacA/LacB family sugar-phosphate isomerase
MKEQVAAHVREAGHPVLDVGTHSAAPADYPDYAEALGMAILNNQADRGILICGSGVGASIAVNKIPGIRAGVCHDCYSAHQGVEHDNMNVLVMGARVIGQSLANDIVDVYLDAQFTCEDRHLRRLEKIRKLETRFCGKNPA